MTNEEAKRNLVYAKRWRDKPDDEALEMAIKALEQTRWIPVSERLPNDGTVVFFTDNKLETGMICYWEDLSWEFEDIIAWMPLPQPYKGESEDAK